MHISMYISSILWSQITNAKFFIFSFLKITNLFALNNATSVVYIHIYVHLHKPTGKSAQLTYALTQSHIFHIFIANT